MRSVGSFMRQALSVHVAHSVVVMTVCIVFFLLLVFIIIIIIADIYNTVNLYELGVDDCNGLQL